MQGLWIVLSMVAVLVIAWHLDPIFMDLMYQFIGALMYQWIPFV